MKFVKSFLLSAMLLGALAACKKEEQPAAPKILVGEETAAFTAEGGTQAIPYSVENAVEGVSIAATTDAEDWLSISTEKPRIIEITAEAYEGAEARTATVVVSYTGAEDVVINVTQGAFVVPFVINVTEAQATAAIFSVSAADSEMTWVAQCVGKEWWDEYEDDDAIYKADMEYFQWMANEENLSLSEYLGKVLLKGSLENLKFNGLDPESDYVIYVYGLSVEGTPTSAIYSAEVTTLPPYDGDITFRIEVTEENHVLDINIIPSHDGVAYTWNIFDKATFEAWGGEMPAAAQDYIDYEVEDYLYWGDIYDASEYFEWYSDFGTVNSQYECLAGTEYIIFASKWNEDCQLVGEMEYIWVTTESVEPSSNKISLTASNPDQSSFMITTTTTNDDPYVILAEPSEWCGWADMTDEEIHQYVLDYYGTWYITDYICQGSLDGARFYDLDPGTEYTVIAYGYEAGVRTTDIQKTTISTLAGGDPSECTFDFEVLETTATTAYINITPSDASHYYYWMVFEADATAEDVKNNILSLVDEWYYGDMYEFAYWELVRGTNEGEVSYLSPETEYRVAAVIMDDTTGEFLSDVVFSEPFSTQEMVYADINIEAVFDKYYDGDALAAAVTDTYDQYKGYAMLPVTLEIEGDYAELYCAIFVHEDGLENPEIVTDSMIYGSLIEQGYAWGTEIRYRAPWDTDLVIMAMAVDYDGNYSKIYRHKFNLTKAGASPIEDIIATKYLPAKLNSTASFKMPENKIELNRAKIEADSRFSTEVLSQKRAECKAAKESAAKEAAQTRLQNRKAAKKLSRGVLAE